MLGLVTIIDAQARFSENKQIVDNDNGLNFGKRRERERKTIAIMIALYCRDRHKPASGHLCETCTSLQAYALQRLVHCPFRENKPVCSHCSVHCYSKDKRAQVKAVMRYAGPRMLFRHPWLAISHLTDGFRVKK
ncbi:MAG: nitrous oxide-stimulated promoter family protein [Tannerella sp.]|nr:nitrous oxide-stimulated promoter family protein [Tannerella sp.]